MRFCGSSKKALALKFTTEFLVTQTLTFHTTISTSAKRLIFLQSAILPQYQSPTMAPSQLPPVFNPTSQDIEMLLAAQCHLGSKNLQVHMEPYLWKTRPDGVNVINIGKTWYVTLDLGRSAGVNQAL